MKTIIELPTGTVIATTEDYERLVRASERLNTIFDMHSKLDAYDFRRFVESLMPIIENADKTTLEPANE